jgi:hypothetical protein
MHVTMMFMFFRDSATGEPSFSEAGAPTAVRRRDLLMFGIGN